MSMKAQHAAESKDVANIAGDAIEHFFVMTGEVDAQVRITVLVELAKDAGRSKRIVYAGTGFVDLAKFANDED